MTTDHTLLWTRDSQVVPRHNIDLGIAAEKVAGEGASDFRSASMNHQSEVREAGIRKLDSCIACVNNMYTSIHWPGVSYLS